MKSVNIALSFIFIVSGIFCFTYSFLNYLLVIYLIFYLHLLSGILRLSSKKSKRFPKLLFTLPLLPSKNLLKILWFSISLLYFLIYFPLSVVDEPLQRIIWWRWNFFHLLFFILFIGERLLTCESLFCFSQWFSIFFLKIIFDILTVFRLFLFWLLFFLSSFFLLSQTFFAPK